MRGFYPMNYFFSLLVLLAYSNIASAQEAVKLQSPIIELAPGSEPTTCAAQLIRGGLYATRFAYLPIVPDSIREVPLSSDGAQGGYFEFKLQDKDMLLEGKVYARLFPTEIITGFLGVPEAPRRGRVCRLQAARCNQKENALEIFDKDKNLLAYSDDSMIADGCPGAWNYKELAVPVLPAPKPTPLVHNVDSIRLSLTSLQDACATNLVRAYLSGTAYSNAAFLENPKYMPQKADGGGYYEFSLRANGRKLTGLVYARLMEFSSGIEYTRANEVPELTCKTMLNKCYRAAGENGFELRDESGNMLVNGAFQGTYSDCR